MPGASWITSLWKAHKLSHTTYMDLSAQLREGHDRRKACVEAVMMHGSATAHAREKEDARALIAAKAKPFKPLPDAIQKWKEQYDSVEERYNMLVLYGPRGRASPDSHGRRRSSRVQYEFKNHIGSYTRVVETFRIPQAR